MAEPLTAVGDAPPTPKWGVGALTGATIASGVPALFFTGQGLLKVILESALGGMDPYGPGPQYGVPLMMLAVGAAFDVLTVIFARQLRRNLKVERALRERLRANPAHAGDMPVVAETPGDPHSTRGDARATDL